MISIFAGYLLLVSVLFAVAAWTTEQALSVRCWPRRFVWILALAASVAFPSGMALTARPSARTILATQPAEHALHAHGRDGVMPVQGLPSGQIGQGFSNRERVLPAKSGTGQTRWLDQLVGALWLASCVATLCWYAIVWSRVAALVRRAPSGKIESADVRMTPALGPAVFGVLRPAILWPAWLGEAPAAVRTAVMAHEREHIAARDPILLGLGLLLVALAPWNPVLWWQLQRMRFAIEADCDQRMMYAAGGPQTYAQVLLSIAEQRITSRLAILMSAPTWLERRIRILLRPPQRLGIIAAACVPFGLAAILAAAQIPAPSLRSPELREPPVQDMNPDAHGAYPVAASVSAVPAKTRKPGNVLALGLVTATTVNVTARVDGQLASVAFLEGRPVKVGQLLASIESPQLQAQLDRATSQLSQDRKMRAEAAISADEAAVSEAKRLLAYTQVRAPISGLAGFRKVDPGNFVHAGDTLLVITQLHPIAVVFPIKEDDLPRVQTLLGSGAMPVVEAWNRDNTARLATGRLTAIDNAIDPETATIKLKALFDNRDGALFPNQFVNVRLHISAR